jgi:hypothetical protein
LSWRTVREILDVRTGACIPALLKEIPIFAGKQQYPLSVVGASILSRHEITISEKKKAAGYVAAESTRFWCAAYVAGHLCAAFGAVPPASYARRAPKQLFTTTEVRLRGLPGRRWRFFHLLNFLFS